MNELLDEALLVSDYFLAYQRELLKMALRTDKKLVKTEKLDQLYERLAKQVEKVKELRRQQAECN